MPIVLHIRIFNGMYPDMTPFRQGLEDRRLGKSLDDCPHPPNTDAWGEWRRGWLIASTSSRLRTEPESDADPRAV